MGQRLVVNIYKNDKNLANAYYHWSAYSYASLETIKPAIEMLESYDSENFGVVDAIKILQATGAEITDGELEYCKENNIEVSRNYETIDRNQGLIAVSEKEMKETLDWAEGIIDIYVDEKQICYGIYWETDEDEFKVVAEEEGREIKVIDVELKDFPIVNFADVSHLMDKIEEAQEADGYFINNETLYGVIY